MLCQKCGFGHMVDDSHHDIRVFKCWVCGDRIYPGYPKRSGALVCSRCGSHMNETNELSLCMDCMKLLNIHTEGLKERNCLRLRHDVHEKKPHPALSLQGVRKTGNAGGTQNSDLISRESPTLALCRATRDDVLIQTHG